jgi:hypothetical protein
MRQTASLRYGLTSILRKDGFRQLAVGFRQKAVKSAGAIGRGFFMENPGGFCRRRLTGWSDGEFPRAQGVEQGQLFRDGPGGEVAAQGAFALQNFGRIKGHG